jgi:hypothetical protein
MDLKRKCDNSVHRSSIIKMCYGGIFPLRIHATLQPISMLLHPTARNLLRNDGSDSKIWRSSENSGPAFVPRLHRSSTNDLQQERPGERISIVKVIYYVFAMALVLLTTACFQESYKQSCVKPAEMERRNSNSVDTLLEQDENKDPGRPALRRLESIHWDSVKHELTWDVSRGERKGGSYQPRSTDHYIINMDDATMTVNGETRRFSEEEATNVRKLLDFVSKYAVESTVWWEQGHGEPADDKGAPTKPGMRAPAKPDTQDNNGNAIHI